MAKKTDQTSYMTDIYNNILKIAISATFYWSKHPK